MWNWPSLRGALTGGNIPGYPFPPSPCSFPKERKKRNGGKGKKEDRIGESLPFFGPRFLVDEMSLLKVPGYVPLLDLVLPRLWDLLSFALFLSLIYSTSSPQISSTPGAGTNPTIPRGWCLLDTSVPL